MQTCHRKMIRRHTATSRTKTGGSIGGREHFRQMATVIKTSNGDRKIPIVTSKGEAVWMDEEQQYSLSDDTFGQASLSHISWEQQLKFRRTFE